MIKYKIFMNLPRFQLNPVILVGIITRMNGGILCSITKVYPALFAVICLQRMMTW